MGMRYKNIRGDHFSSLRLRDVLLGMGILLCAAVPVRAETTGDAIIHADDHPDDWLTHGRTYSEQRYSPLKQINAKTIGHLHLAWHYDLDTNRGQEATPLIINGVMYTTTAWSKVKALDAATGRLLWAYDPKVDGKVGVRGCCDIVNRGLGYWNGKLYLATFDNRLIALDSRDGKVIWSINTIPTDADLGQQQAYTITGAPRIAKGRVLIGNGGAEFGARGFISAFDAETGKLDWRFFTVPNPHNRPDHAPSDTVLMTRAYPTWSPTGAWVRQGGGGTVWDSIVYDPVTDLVYFGAGNGSPWSYGIRSNGKGDNLFLDSIVAVKPDTGEYVWHFQETPEDQWDYTSTQQIMTLDLPLDGQMRHVIVHAPKNGFFYVLDAATGEFISGKNFVFVNWAKGLDPKTGRPIFNPDAQYSVTGKPFYVFPGDMGGHGIAAMSYSPRTGLVYLPTQQVPDHLKGARKFKPLPDGWNLGLDIQPDDKMPSVEEQKAGVRDLRGSLVAWDPVEQKARWEVVQKGPANGGVLSTAGDLVFQGLTDGTFHAYDAHDGKDLFSFDAQSGIIASPVSYRIGGRQYVAIEVGWGGSYGLFATGLARQETGSVNHSRVLAFALDGRDHLPTVSDDPVPSSPPPASFAPRQALAGSQQYLNYCQYCHGANVEWNGVLPDLRKSPAIQDKNSFYAIVGKGALSSFGMDGFEKSMKPDEIESIRQFIIERAHQTLSQP
ncbi:PQQ-dependent alcohol dehydrogenase large subunit [Komagataeibacter diospyri]|uniref:PQQ-dependent alcohol dehydrogenase large subunit n=2 Tax=Komagataeibacter diospyri TaxID=1932662 RepID=A0A4P5NRR9_9PROT|nr:PQQ-dependent alcohol dehydrogenase large subunit [Komagataeibacter diospyri]